VQFGISSITLGIDPMIIARGTPGRETGSTPNILNEFEIHLRVNLLGLCHYVCPRQTYERRIRASLIQYKRAKQGYFSKRTMYGRAAFPLLRQRVLHAL